MGNPLSTLLAEIFMENNHHTVIDKWHVLKIFDTLIEWDFRIFETFWEILLFKKGNETYILYIFSIVE